MGYIRPQNPYIKIMVFIKNKVFLGNENLTNHVGLRTTCLYFLVKKI